jgi:hypothetical protein
MMDPWYIKIFHGRQAARSLHFLALGAFILFFIGHVALVALHGLKWPPAMVPRARALGNWSSGRKTRDYRKPHSFKRIVVAVIGLVFTHSWRFSTTNRSVGPKRLSRRMSLEPDQCGSRDYNATSRGLQM